MHNTRLELRDGTVQTSPVYKIDYEAKTIQLFGKDPVEFDDIVGGAMGGQRTGWGEPDCCDGACGGFMTPISLALGL